MTGRKYGGRPNRRGDVTTNIGALRAYIDSFDLVLRVNDKSPRTRATYCDAALWFAGWLTDRGLRQWADVGVPQLREFFVHMQDLEYKQGYRNNIGRSLQAFFKFLYEEEGLVNPFDRIKPPAAPKMGDSPPPIIEMEQLAMLVKDAEKNRGFKDRRDAALLRLFASTGCRLGEITNLRTDQVDKRERTAYVTGKGGRSRTVKFDHKCALALDRYLRMRDQHPDAGLPALWLGRQRGDGLSSRTIANMITNRGRAIGIKIYPHLLRHTFSHNWLDQGGREGDLMELNGWQSPQMLNLYGRSARNARARRAYDNVNVMGGV